MFFIQNKCIPVWSLRTFWEDCIQTFNKLIFYLTMLTCVIKFFKKLFENFIHYPMKTAISLFIVLTIIVGLFLLQENLSTEPSKIADDDLLPCCNNIDPFTPSSQNIHTWGYKCNNGPEVTITLACCKNMWNLYGPFPPASSPCPGHNCPDDF